jgi:hypothetical protein
MKMYKTWLSQNTNDPVEMQQKTVSAESDNETGKM